jgi:hypothetical protein
MSETEIGYQGAIDQELRDEMADDALLAIDTPQRRFCLDCKHIRLAAWGKQGEFHKCDYFSPDKINLVTGTPWRQKVDYCSILRESSDPVNCGPTARYWEHA